MRILRKTTMISVHLSLGRRKTLMLMEMIRLGLSILICKAREAWARKLPILITKVSRPLNRRSSSRPSKTSPSQGPNHGRLMRDLWRQVCSSRAPHISRWLITRPSALNRTQAPPIKWNKRIWSKRLRVSTSTKMTNKRRNSGDRVAQATISGTEPSRFWQLTIAAWLKLDIASSKSDSTFSSHSSLRRAWRLRPPTFYHPSRAV